MLLASPCPLQPRAALAVAQGEGSKKSEVKVLPTGEDLGGAYYFLPYTPANQTRPQ